MAVKLRAEGLVKRYGRVRALEIDKLSIEADILAVVGPNGSGKTTLLSITAGLRYPTRGVLDIDGFIPYLDRERALSEIAFLFDRPRLPLTARVRDVVALAKDLGDADGVEEFVGAMGIGEFMDRQLSSLSMGEAQLVGLLVVLNMGARIVVLDEPFAHLDVRRASLLSGVLRDRCRGSGRGCIYTTHSPWEAESLADHMVLLRDGRLEWWGGIDDLLRSNVLEVYLKPGAGDAESILSRAGLRILSCFGYICLIEAGDTMVLEELYDAGAILGFKRAGVRSVYAGSPD